ncbi:cytochrome P450 [Mycobacterium sp. MUNTM1]
MLNSSMVSAPTGVSALVRLAKTGRDVVAFKMNGEPHFLVNTPDGAKHVLNQKSGYSKDTLANRFIKTEVADGILTAEGHHWAMQRRMLNPALKDVAQVRAVTGRCVEVLIDSFDRIANTGEQVNISAAMSDLTLAVTTRLLFGFDHRPFFQQCENITARLVNANFASPESDGTMRPYREALADTICRLRREPPHDGYPGLVWHALERSGGASGQAAIDQVTTLLLAGYETTANSLSWTWIELTRHPDEYFRWQRALDDDPDTPDTDAAFKEALRLYPPAWMIGRRALRDDRIGDVTVPAQAVVAISPYLLHRHAHYWEQPDKFRPDRFRKLSNAVSHNYAYLPFGAGPRFCIGSLMAQHEARVILSTIGRRFHFDAVDLTDPVPDHQFILRAPAEYLVTVRRRAGSR